MTIKMKISKQQLKKVLPDVSWQNPGFNFVFQAMNPLDYSIRYIKGLSDLPPYSTRIRSNGVTNQFGGQVFYNMGNLLADHLKNYASLSNKSDVLEIGCGCGRTAFALSKILDNGKYTGMDIEQVSLHSCQQRKIFQDKKFKFDYLDVQNDEYNPEGKNPADIYKFPYANNQFDVIFLVSVFTHMLTKDVKNYISEISRMLKPGGTCMVTTFLMDEGRNSHGLSFPYNDQEHYFYSLTMPEIAVGYYLNFYINQFNVNSMTQVNKPLLGSWRNTTESLSASGFGQDILFFTKAT